MKIIILCVIESMHAKYWDELVIHIGRYNVVDGTIYPEVTSFSIILLKDTAVSASLYLLREKI